MKQQFFFKLLLLLLAIGSTSAKNNVSAQIVPTRYHIYTYNPSSPHVNPFKKKGSTGITWAQHMQNVANDNLTSYMDPVVASYDKYLTEAAYCINFNRAFLGITSDVTLAQAQKILLDCKGVLVTVPGGVMYVLGIDPSTGKVACFLNPAYTEVAMLEYTSPFNGNKVYVSKYSGKDEECCINLIIDLQPRTGPTATVVHDLDTVYIDKTVFVHDQDVYTTNYYTEEVYETNYGGSWFPTQPMYYGPGYYMMPFNLCQPVFGCQPTYRCNSGGIACAMVPATPENKTVIDIYIEINNTNIINNNTVQVVHPDQPRPTPTTPLYNNTGGSGEQANNGGGGGDHPVVTTPTGNDNGGGAGDGTVNDSGTGDGANNSGGAGKKENNNGANGLGTSAAAALSANSLAKQRTIQPASLANSATASAQDEQPYSSGIDLARTAKANTTADSRPASANIYNSSNEKKYVDTRYSNGNTQNVNANQQRTVERTAPQQTLPTRTVQQYLADQARARDEQLQAQNSQQYSNDQPSPNYNQQYSSDQPRPNYGQQYQGSPYRPNYDQQRNNNGRTNYDNANYRGNYGNQGNAQHGTTTNYDVNRTKPQVNYNQPKTNSYDLQRQQRSPNQPTGTSNMNVQRQQRPDVQRGGGSSQQMNAARPPMRTTAPKVGR